MCKLPGKGKHTPISIQKNAHGKEELGIMNSEKVIPPQMLLNTFTKSLHKIDNSVGILSWFIAIVLYNVYLLAQYPIFISWWFLVPVGFTLLAAVRWSNIYNSLKGMSANLEADKSEPQTVFI
jgi:hypothetical protein